MHLRTSRVEVSLAAAITFRFDGGDQGFATGTLKGDLLEVRYSERVQHSDFENAVYRRSR
jgi:hypothetical protein